MIDGILHRVRTGVHWRDLPERFGPWKPSTNATACGRPTRPGSVCCSRSRRTRTRPVRSTGTSQPPDGPSRRQPWAASPCRSP
ncbi:transposase [Streptomyces sp. Vc74B-19]|nr:transposase [Actinospica acidiphila]MBT3165537.1 transposase [Streptomyces sp. Vc74B-19]